MMLVYRPADQSWKVALIFCVHQSTKACKPFFFTEILTENLSLPPGSHPSKHFGGMEELGGGGTEEASSSSSYEDCSEVMNAEMLQLAIQVRVT